MIKTTPKIISEILNVLFEIKVFDVKEYVVENVFIVTGKSFNKINVRKALSKP